jgi:hypothetical protein
MYPQQQKKHFKRGNLNSSGFLDYLVLRLEGRHNSSDRYANLCLQVYFYIELHGF